MRQENMDRSALPAQLEDMIAVPLSMKDLALVRKALRNEAMRDETNRGRLLDLAARFA